MQKRIALILILSVLLTVVMAIYFFSFTKNNDEVKKIFKKEQILSKCLNENFDASYKIDEKEIPLADIIIYITDKNIGKEISSFRIDNIFKTSTSIELHRCGIYVIKFFNYDPKISKQKSEFNVEFWKYYYNGKGTKLLLSEDFSYDFRIDPEEKYIVLEKGYLSKDDYALIIKDLNTKEDIFTFSAASIFKQYPNVVGNFNMQEWTKDSRYFWGDIFDGAYVNGYFRIDTQNWKADVYEAPDGAMGGFPLNVNTGYVPIQPGQVWTGDYQLTEELKEQYKKEGKKSELYLYNLFTKEKIQIETSNEPLFYFEPKWLSDNELEYELPTGEKKVYIINEKR